SSLRRSARAGVARAFSAPATSSPLAARIAGVAALTAWAIAQIARSFSIAPMAARILAAARALAPIMCIVVATSPTWGSSIGFFSGTLILAASWSRCLPGDCRRQRRALRAVPALEERPNVGTLRFAHSTNCLARRRSIDTNARPWAGHFLGGGRIEDSAKGQSRLNAPMDRDESGT